MIQAVKVVSQVVWTVCVVIVGTAVGAIFGWEHYGGFGAIGLGFIGLSVGALLAASPVLVLQFIG